jgi:protein gp37
MGETKIQWTDRTWNPTVGCTKVSAGCARCYAKTLHDKRHKAHRDGNKVPAQYAHPFEKLQLMPDRLHDPLSWRKPQRVFVNSVSDLFHEDVPFEFLDRVFTTMALAKRHTFQVLTKRPERMQEYFATYRASAVLPSLRTRFKDLPPDDEFPNGGTLIAPLPNVHLGVSVENQAAADERIPFLLKTPAAVRFLSCEPLLGPVDIRRFLCCPWCKTERPKGTAGETWHVVGGVPMPCPLDSRGSAVDNLHWVIVGGESGPNSRPFELDWARAIQNQCDAAGVPWFFKQAGSNPRDWTRGDAPNQEPPELITLRLKDRKGGDLSELPAALRVRDFPTTQVA